MEPEPYFLSVFYSYLYAYSYSTLKHVNFTGTLGIFNFDCILFF